MGWSKADGMAHEWDFSAWGRLADGAPGASQGGPEARRRPPQVRLPSALVREAAQGSGQVIGAIPIETRSDSSFWSTNLPQSNPVVITPRSESAAVGTKSHTHYITKVFAQCLDLSSAGYIP